MIRRNVIGIAGAIVLLAVTACGDDSGGGGDDDDGDSAVARDGGSDANTPDASDASARPDSTTPDSGTAGDAAVTPDSGNIDASTSTDAGDIDAARDAEAGVSSDAQSADAAADASPTPADASTDAATLDAAALDASADAGSDASADAGTDAAIALPTLAARYTFDENTGTTAADTAGTFAAASLINGATWTPGKQGSAIDLAGGTSNQHVALPANILDTCNDITVALWMRLGSTPPWARLLDIDGTVNGFLFFTPTQDVSGTPHLLFNIFYPDGPGPNDQGVSAPYPAGTVLVNNWHHVAFTLSGGTGRLYFNGVQIGSSTLMIKPSDLTIGASGHAWLGRSTFGTDPYLDASIDDLRVSCTAYSAEQIAAIAQ